MEYPEIKFDVNKIQKIEPISNGQYEVFLADNQSPVTFDKVFLESVLTPKEIYYYL